MKALIAALALVTLIASPTFAPSASSFPSIVPSSPRFEDDTAVFRKGRNETGTVEGQNVTVEYHWPEGQHDRLPALLADLVRRQVAVIATAGQRAHTGGQSWNRDDPDRLRRRR
jgi:hypothetical protein